MELFRILGSVVVDNSEGVEAIRNTANEGEKAQGKLSGAFEKIGGFAVQAGKVIASGLAVGVGALATLTTMSVKSYAEYEQLVGGVETLFGAGGQSIEQYAESVGKTVEAVRGEYETLMKSQETVLQNANEAYKNAGMSANEYMETVTGFSASLIQSLSKGAQTNLDELNASLANQYTETERALEDQYDAVKSNWDDMIALAKKNKASNVDILKKQRDEELKLLKRKHSDSLAELKAYNKEQLAEAEKANNVSTKSAEAQLEASKKADQAIRDMADNCNKMGSSMESIQNAYQGFAKGNYTMLDNLKLGYSGTQEEMKRLIQDASRMTDIQKELGITVDENSMSFANIVDAISVVQKSMGIMGTTSKEASETIEGSMSAMKASWQNLVTGFGNEDADLSGLIDQFTESAVTVLHNVLPRIEIILGGIAEAIPQIVPKIAERLPELIEALLPPLLQGAIALCASLASALPDIVMVLFQTAKDLFGQLWDFISLDLLDSGVSFEDACGVISNAFSIVWGECQEIWTSVGQPIFDALVTAFTMAKDGVQPIIDKIVEFATSSETANTATMLWNEAIDFLAGVAQKVADVITTISDWCVENQETLGVIAVVVGSIGTAFLLVSTAIGLVNTAVTIWNTVGVIATAVTGGLGTAVAFLTSPITLVTLAIGALIAIGVLLYQNWDEIKAKAIELWNSIVERFTAIKESITTSVTEAKNNALELFGNLKEKALETFTKIKDGIKEKLDNAKEVVSNAITKIKNFFKFDWSLPKLKMPHFKISGEFSLNPPSVPSFGIDWYAKAMDNPMIMDTPTAFGINASGQIMAGGEAGSEVVSGTETLMNMISNAVATQNTALIAVLERILDAILALDANMGGNMREAIENTRFELNNREFARLVKAVN